MDLDIDGEVIQIADFKDPELFSSLYRIFHCQQGDTFCKYR